MSSITKIVYGIPAKGNTISRHRKALKRAAVIHGCLGTALAGCSIFDFAQKKVGWSSFSVVGVLASIYNINAMKKAHDDLTHEYDKIVSRAKQIYKK